jgi:hypothetical protein
MSIKPNFFIRQEVNFACNKRMGQTANRLAAHSRSEYEKLRRGEKESGQNSLPLNPCLLPALFFSGGAGALPLIVAFGLFVLNSFLRFGL